ncbi:hypothetical protein K1T71_007474 [Dendrolimus kikuchii]|uniref:Uncharacterized protein n=1 Tax=Dendrolimus kikuchii TaxID=765133 RepID=A0ACC1D0Q4_9NEOP|nr:hypothetical protein K1T71_007474 [Dendrolimus kikuchii]
MKLAVFLLILAVVEMCLLSAAAQSDQPRNYCGRHLANTLAYWCPTIYGEKRSGSTNTIHGYANGWFTRQVRNSIQEPGIIEECCLQPCTLNVLVTYC